MLAPLLLPHAAALGSRRPRDLLDQLRLAWGLRGLDVRGTADATRLFTMSIPDLLDEWFESPEVKGVLAINGIIGTWAGPGRARHRVRDDAPHDRRRRRRPARVVGLPDRRHGRGRRRDPPLGRVVRRDGAHRLAGRAHRRARTARSAARRPTPAATFRAPIVVAATHPQITFLRQIDRAELPDDFVARHRTLALRSGTVKVNVALSELPELHRWPGDEPHEHYTGAIELCHSIDYLERAFQDAREGRAAARPFSDSVIPSTLDRTLCPEGTHVMSMFTQWVPHTWSDEPHPAELEAYADRVIDGYDELAPELQASRSSTAR